MSLIDRVQDRSHTCIGRSLGTSLNFVLPYRITSFKRIRSIRSTTVPAMKVLVTGGAGYIGSVTATALEQAGHTPIVLDSLMSGPEAYVRDRIFYRGDIADRALLTRIVSEHPDLECTIHMAARVVVEESVAMPYEYYRDNVVKSLELFDQLRSAREATGGVLVLRLGVRGGAEPGGVRGLADRPTLPVRPDQTHDGDGAAGSGRRDRASRADPALLQSDRGRPRPSARNSRPGAFPRTGPAGPRGTGAARRLRHHRH